MSGRGLGLDFAHPHARKPWWAWLALAAGLAAAAWTGREYERAMQDNAAVRQSVQALRAARPVRAVVQRRDPAAEAALAARQSALRQMEMPWGALLTTLQRTRPADIGLIGLEAEGRRGILTLTAEARDYPAMIDYYRRLQGVPGLSGVTLTQHGMRQDGNAQPVRFVLRGRWGGGLEDGGGQAR